MKRFILATSAVVATMTGPAYAHAQTTVPLTSQDLLHRVAVLADDSMLGRDAGQIGNIRATAYVARELERLGLRPAGTEGFFQAIPLVTRGPVRDATLSVGGTAIAANAIQSARAIATAPFGGVFERQNVATVYGGLIGATLVDPSAVRGKVAVFLAQPGANGQIGNAYAGNGVLTPYAEAAAIIIVGLDQMTPQAVNSLRLARVVLGGPSATRTVPAALITTAAAQIIFDGAFGELQPGAPGKAVSGRFGMIDTPTPQPARNVIGIIRGTDGSLSRELIAIGSHTDHVGVGAPVDHDSVRAANEVLRPLGANGQPRIPQAVDMEHIREIRDSLRRIHPPRMDSIFNGADDDASGVAVALELAEYFAKNPPKRSLLFVFHTAEEKGLYGADYFTSHPTIARESIVAAINMDQVSRGGPDDVAGSQAKTVYLLGTRRLSTSLGDLVETINARPENGLRLDYALDAPGHPANGYCRSDHYMYARYGIPVVFLSAGWHRDYHMVTDEVAYVQPETMLRIGSLARDIVSEVANARTRPLVDQPKPDPNGTCRQ